MRYGNYRCSLIGADLNRRWLSPNEMLHPTIYYTKKMILCLKDYHEIALFCDIHGHSTKNSTFMYGNIIKAIDGID